MSVRVTSFSSASTYNTCPRKFLFSRSDEEQSGTSYAMDFGWLVHLGIEHAYKNPHDPINAALDAMKVHKDQYSAQTLQTAVSAVTSYVPYLIQHFTPITHNSVVLNEVAFDYTIASGVQLRGIIDAIVTDANGKIILVDWKTRGRMLSEDTVEMDGQLYLYAYIAKTYLGIEVDGLAQVQLSSNPPTMPILKGDGSLDKRKGKTTPEKVEQAAKFYNIPIQDLYEQLGTKVVGVEDFISVVTLPYNSALVNAAKQAYVATVQTANNDRSFRPVMSAYTCQRCYYREACRNFLLDNS